MGVIKLKYNNAYKTIDNKYLIDNKVMPISLIEDFLYFYNLTLQDLPELAKLSTNLKEDKRFKKLNKSKFYSLTKKENEIFRLVTNGYKTNEIADKLFIATSTVDTHRKNIKQKLDTNSVFDWYKYAKVFCP
ncbi:regulatory LuxR family protein [Lutibacter sp. Hel_I_33_5]|uniref:helix-turn-helix domain-containing protein n=1 Tax=Lutibacter sp. Hel_I_33_5 TaxID=1566289 RepID=UPI0011A35955|nr:helix-turn-helix transcriptional regulator [Lutibacter sp. Hel_I_33_5]TVZ54835.1 regulatory LuxR family protein [Lutibacter sp. Hel_I_33_5]